MSTGYQHAGLLCTMGKCSRSWAGRNPFRVTCGRRAMYCSLYHNQTQSYTYSHHPTSKHPWRDRERGRHLLDWPNLRLDPRPTKILVSNEKKLEKLTLSIASWYVAWSLYIGFISNLKLKWSIGKSYFRACVWSRPVKKPMNVVKILIYFWIAYLEYSKIQRASSTWPYQFWSTFEWTTISIANR